MLLHVAWLKLICDNFVCLLVYGDANLEIGCSRYGRWIEIVNDPRNILSILVEL